MPSNSLRPWACGAAERKPKQVRPKKGTDDSWPRCEVPCLLRHDGPVMDTAKRLQIRRAIEELISLAEADGVTSACLEIEVEDGSSHQLPLRFGTEDDKNISLAVLHGLLGRLH
jgi:hypothetical protein